MLLLALASEWLLVSLAQSSADVFPAREELANVTETLFGKQSFDVNGESLDTEGEGLISYSASSQQGSFSHPIISSARVDSHWFVCFWTLSGKFYTCSESLLLIFIEEHWKTKSAVYKWPLYL